MFVKKLLCCGIVSRELEHLLQQRQANVTYLDPALHVDLDRMAVELGRGMQQVGEGGALVLGTQCHPDLTNLAAAKGMHGIQAKNCIEMLLGDEMARLDSEAKTFYITGGWLNNWRGIFVEGLKWDEIDARQNFGYYDRILLLDTGMWPIDDEMILEFYEYTQVPVEIVSVTLDNMGKLVDQILQKEGG
ncbi:MAG: DUF1638 domain-containing protein [Clostridia bacterium]|nr:DUF1638 domain-containing protein [Clostridia bacterium]